jgi:KDO2-lipid IV(A) lauroyltransferase
VRQNQQIIAGDTLDGQELQHAVRQVFTYTAHALYDLYRHLGDLEKAGELFVIDPSFQVLLDWSKVERRGVIVAGLHMCGFDLAYQWLCKDLLHPLGVTLPNPQGGRALEFQRRLELGMDLVPGSFEGLRQAIRFLRQGGMVVTGIDHPGPAYQPRPQFFGHPAMLPTHHIFLALKTGCPVVVVATCLQASGRYILNASDPIEMDPYAGREDQLRGNGEKVLAVAEAFIRRSPQQWLISQVVWGE